MIKNPQAGGFQPEPRRLHWFGAETSTRRAEKNREYSETPRRASFPEGTEVGIEHAAGGGGPWLDKVAWSVLWRSQLRDLTCGRF